MLQWAFGQGPSVILRFNTWGCRSAQCWRRGSWPSRCRWSRCSDTCLPDTGSSGNCRHWYSKTGDQSNQSACTHIGHVRTLKQPMRLIRCACTNLKSSKKWTDGAFRSIHFWVNFLHKIYKWFWPIVFLKILFLMLNFQNKRICDNSTQLVRHVLKSTRYGHVILYSRQVMCWASQTLAM